ncbi:MAG: hypothetical protein VR75_03860 [Hyphomonadaceae bacterium BRH_c29]|nr:MAG: hypothetical protein VR75_03860 [Hyphomonadaceae bacterium BRH_c29]HAY05293.1 hypothetical protein [Hyphomonas sp.]
MTGHVHIAGTAELNEHSGILTRAAAVGAYGIPRWIQAKRSKKTTCRNAPFACKMETTAACKN